MTSRLARSSSASLALGVMVACTSESPTTPGGDAGSSSASGTIGGGDAPSTATDDSDSVDSDVSVGTTPTTTDADPDTGQDTSTTDPGVVNDCGTLPASGTWERITPDTGHADAENNRWYPAGLTVHPTISGTVFVNMHQDHLGATPGAGLYRSDDCGATWTLLSTGENSELVNSGSWWHILVDWNTPDVIFSVSGYGAGGLWRSSNGGVDWQQVLTPDVGQYLPNLFINGVTMDPADPRHLLVSSHGGCSGEYAPNCLVETKDGGDTWRVVGAPPANPEGAEPYIIDDTTWLYATFDGLFVTSDAGVTWDQRAPRSFGSNHPTYRASTGLYYVPGDNGLLESPDGLEWTSTGGGRMVGFVSDGTTMYTADQWSFSYQTALETAPTTWTPFTSMGMDEAADGNSPYLDFDRDHHILYAVTWPNIADARPGLWRIVTE